MGLKYTVFMIKGTADDFYKKLFETFPNLFIDESDLMMREREWYERPVKSIEDIKKEPEPDLAGFIRDEQKRLSVWWMDHPTEKGFVVGGFTSHWIHDAEYLSRFALVFRKCGVDEFLRVIFAHGSNDGNIIKLHLQKEPPEIDTYEHKKGEEERWERYSKRVNKICGFPVTAWHNYISDYKIHFVPWKYLATIKKKENEDVKSEN
jgi:hypothetical protein